jgi:hypothetical protein
MQTLLPFYIKLLKNNDEYILFLCSKEEGTVEAFANARRLRNLQNYHSGAASNQL